MLAPGSLLDMEWLKGSPEGREMISSVLERNQLKRKTFGLLEKPVISQHVTADTEVKYKLFFVGKSGVGKTSTVAKLSGNSLPSMHSETPGIQTTTIYWPGKIKQLNRSVIFQLQLWDAGETALKKFDHILSACTNKTDAIIFLFSFVDKSSFEEVSHQITRYSGPKDNTCKLVIGTKFDQYAHSEITQRDIRDFEQNWKIPILKIRNIPESEARSDFNDVAQVLNILCEHLWHRDILLAGKTDTPRSNVNSGQLTYM